MILIQHLNKTGKLMTKRKVLLLFMILFISSCSENIQINGLSNTIMTQMQIEVGITTKDELNKKYGPPVFEGIFNNNVIYYISHESRYKNFNPRKTNKLLIFKITLDTEDKVKSLKKYTEENAQNIIVSKEKTNTINNEGILLKQILENLQKNKLKN